MRKYLKLFRVKHYIKNVLVLIPLVFSEDLFNTDKLFSAVLGVLSFCFISSAVYIINDIKDVEADRLHPTKKYRPIASGAVNVKTAFILALVSIILSAAFHFMTGNITGIAYILIYLAVNIAYSFKLKDKPLVDVVILASGFAIRILYGGLISETVVSSWLFLVILTLSFYMGLGKRRNELRGSEESRTVLKYYSYSFLDKNMYVCASLVNIFYALWAKDFSDEKMIYTVPLVIVILMKYSLNIESDSDGDPVEVILRDKVLIALVAVYVICVFTLIYII